MLLQGKPIVRETRSVTIERTNSDPITLIVSSITVGVRRDFDAIWPRPKVPVIVTQGKNGREEKENWRDDRFTEELDERTQLQNIYLMYRVLEADPNIQFENKPTDKTALRALAAEIRSSGLSEGDIIVILKEALKASNLSQEEIDKVKSDF
jgi:hypothetical protein